MPAACPSSVRPVRPRLRLRPVRPPCGLSVLGTHRKAAQQGLAPIPQTAITPAAVGQGAGGGLPACLPVYRRKPPVYRCEHLFTDVNSRGTRPRLFWYSVSQSPRKVLRGRIWRKPAPSLARWEATTAPRGHVKLATACPLPAQTPANWCGGGTPPPRLFLPIPPRCLWPVRPRCGLSVLGCACGLSVLPAACPSAAALPALPAHPCPLPPCPPPPRLRRGGGG